MLKRLIAATFALSFILVGGLLAARTYYAGLKLAAAEPQVTESYTGKPLPAIDRSTKKLAILFGDSRISQWSPRPGWPGFAIVNQGVGGDTTAWLLHRFEQDVASHRPDLVVIQAGINDMVAAGLNAQAEERITANAVVNLTTMVQAARASGAHVILMTIIPPAQPEFWRQAFWSNRILELTESVNDKLLPLHAPPHTWVVDTTAVLKPGGAWLQDMNADTLHLTRLAYVTLNAALEPLLADKD